MDLDDAQDWAWCDSQFAAIETYVKTQQIPHGMICDWPEWYTAGLPHECLIFKHSAAETSF
ncbi:DUF4826 family protein [Alishewanella jeotgali]|uniref:Uncharacterized protein n=1 Tax=Alishewanella jeotgali KCTC 22429 TaxID=1129374 RepID=H3ZFX3_9ALTE|nr:DUF4826 family protein [Alishewanella jeotgali]EHR40481.1 hypothetical protein AJE_11349 [Alishewanella jeotgali KCTC 22429]